MAIDPDVSALKRLAERPDDDLLAIVGLLDDSASVSTGAILHVLHPDLAQSFEEEDLVPRFRIDLKQARDNGRARIDAYMASRREYLRNLICPLVTSSGAERDLLVNFGPAVLADILAQSGGEPNAALLAMVAYMLTRSADSLCSDWDPPAGSASVIA